MNASAQVTPGVSPSAPPPPAGFLIHVLPEDDSAFVTLAGLKEATARLTGSSAKTRGALTYIPPAQAIAQMMAAGMSTPEAIEAWLQDATAHLKVARKWRKKLRVVQTPRTPAARTAVATALNEAWQDSVDTLPALPESDDDNEVSPFLIAIATLELHEHDTAHAAMSELLARSTGPFDDLMATRACTEILRTEWQEQITTSGGFQRDMSRLMTTQIHDLEEALQRRTTVANTLNGEKNALQKRLSDANEASGKLTKELYGQINQLHASAKTRNAQNAELKKSLETLRTARQAEATQFKSRIKAEQDARNVAQTAHTGAVATLKDQLDEALKGRAAHKATSLKHAARIDALAQELEEAQKALNATQAERDAAIQDAEQARSEVQTTSQARIDTLVQEVTAAQEALAQEQSLSKTLNSQITELESVLTGTQGQVRDALGASSGDLHDILVSTRDALNNAQSDTARKAEMKSVFKEQSRQLETALQMVEQQRQALQAQLDDVYASTSWKVTKPIRSIKRAIRK